MVKIALGLLLFTLVSCDQSGLPDPEVHAQWKSGQITEDDIQYSIEALGKNAQEKLKDSTKLQKYFDRVISQEIESQLAQSIQDEETQFLFHMEEERNISNWYTQYFLGDHLGFTTTQLLLYFNKHKEKYLQDSLVTQAPQGSDAFELVRKQVAMDLALEKYDVRGFYDKNKSKFRANPQAQLSWILLDSKEDAQAIVQQIQGSQMTWEQAVEKWSQDSISRAQQGDLGVVGPMKFPPQIKAFITQMRKDLFYSKSWKPDQVYAIESGAQKAIFKMNSFQQGRDREYEEVKGFALKKYLPTLLKDLHQKTIDSLKVKFKVGIHEPKLEDIEKLAIQEYQAHPEKYQVEPSFHVSYYQGEQLDELVKEGQALQQKLPSFQDLGWVKLTHSLPQEVGLVQGLSEAAKQAKSGLIQKIFRVKQKPTLFYIHDYKPGKLKPFDRVKTSIEIALKNQTVSPVSDSLVLAWSKDNRKLVTGKLYNQVISKMSPRALKKLTQKQVVDHLVGVKLFAQEAQNHGYVLRPEVKAKLKEFRRKFWSQKYQAKLLWDVQKPDSSLLQKSFETQKELVRGRSFEAAYPDLVLYHQIPKDEWKYIQEVKRENQPTQFDLLKNFKYFYIGQMKYQQQLQWMKDNQFQVLQPKWKVSWTSDPQIAWNQISQLKSTQGITESKDQIEKFLAQFPDHPKQDSALYLYAQYSQDTKRWDRALLSLEKLLIKYPQSPLAYRAAFLKGYIYYENIKEDQLAIQAFEKMLQDHPKTELSDDAEVLLKDLKSGRKHLKELMENLGKPKN